MPAKLIGATIFLLDANKTTPAKQAKITGMSFTVELRTLDVFLYRYDVADGFVPLPSFAATLRLFTSNQQESVLSDTQGRISAFFPDTQIEVQLSPGSVPAGHRAVLNYPIKTLKKNTLTVVFIPDSLRRYYPLMQLL